MKITGKENIVGDHIYKNMKGKNSQKKADCTWVNRETVRTFYTI